MNRPVAIPPLAKLWRRAVYYVLVPKTWLQLTLHNTWGILNVLDVIWLRPMPGGLIDTQHPFCTGINSATGKPIWNSNVLFRSKRRESWPGHLPPEPDEAIINKVGNHLRKQVLMAAAGEGFPTGR